MSNQRWTRREEPREGGFGRLIGWRPAASAHRRRRGWLNDLSLSGLSFLVGAPCPPDLGDDVDVLLDRTGRRGLYHVVRTEALSGNLTMVACRKDPPMADRFARAPLWPLRMRCRPAPRFDGPETRLTSEPSTSSSPEAVAAGAR